MPTTTSIVALQAAAGVKGNKIRALRNGSLEAMTDLIHSLVSSNPDQKDPFYVLDLGTVVDLFGKWTRHLPFVQPYFAVKSNPEPALIGALAALGAGFDCASRAEIAAVLALGVGPDRIVYANPCKAVSHVRYAACASVNLATFDSVFELEKMSRHHPACSLLLRIKPPLDTGVRRSLSSKYGALPEEVGPLLLAARSMNLAVVGVCFHVGTSATVLDTFDAAIKSARETFDLARTLYGFKMHVLDIGGGFVAGKLFEEAGRAIKTSIEAHFGDWAGELRVVAEPGRYFAETAATLATCVIGKRVRGGVREYWINDGIYGSMGCIKMDLVDNVPLLPLKKAHHGTRSYASTVFGPTCDSFDVVGRELQLPELEVGDWLVSPNMGAYTKALGSDFNGFSTSAIPVYLANSLCMHDPKVSHEYSANEEEIAAFM